MNKLDLIETARELAESLNFDEHGAHVETLVAGRYYFAPLPPETNAKLTHLLHLINQIESGYDLIQKEPV